jgi:uncharacterized protein YqeY
MDQEPELKKKLAEELKQAMKSGATTKRDTLRLLITAINYAQSTSNKPLTDADVLGVVAKEVKRHQESIDAFNKGNRSDLVAKEEAEMAVLQVYAPKPMSHDDIVAAAKEVIGAVGAKGPGDKGKVMQQLMPKLKGKADGKEINDVVTQLLGQ